MAAYLVPQLSASETNTNTVSEILIENLKKQIKPLKTAEISHAVITQERISLVLANIRIYI